MGDDLDGVSSDAKRYREIKRLQEDLVTDQTKYITEQQRLEAFALFVLATQRYQESRELERGIARALKHDEEFVNLLSDAIYSDLGTSSHVFDKQLSYAGYVVRPETSRPK